jgi:hypothetical protein
MFYLFLLLAFHQSVIAIGVAPGQIKNWVVYGDSYTDITSHSDGGTVWPYYVVGYGKYKMFSVAHSGAVCSNVLTPRTYPDIVTNEIPEYLAAKNSLGYAAHETLFSVWIGTNDVGVLSNGGQAPGVTYKNTSECATGWIKTMYDNGARNFIFMNVCSIFSELIYGMLIHRCFLDGPSQLCSPIFRQFFCRSFLDKEYC